MSASRTLQSPLIVGRDEMLALAELRLADAAAGRGGMLLLAGEAGIGKTRLRKAIMRHATLAGFRVAGGDLAPQDNLVPLAAIHEMARSMPGDFGDLGPRLLELRGGKGNDSLASRRILVREIAETIVDAIDRPTALSFEDLQWADELTLEVIGNLARSGGDRPLLVVGAYRLDELPAGSIHREWRARLLMQRLAEELRLERLSAADTALVTTLILATGLPASREVAEAVHERTNGIPLYVEELLAALGDAALDARAIRDVAVPDTIEDAVLARAARLSEQARAVARAASVMGRCFAPDVLAGIMDRPSEALEAPIQELVDASILYPFDYLDRGYYDFRHQLLRDALYDTVPAAELRRLHARAGEFGAELAGASEVHASLHFERAGLRSQAFRAALSGARAAAAMSSRREAYELYRRAVANIPDELTAAERGQLYAEYVEAASAIDSIPALEDAANASRRHFLDAGDKLGAARALLSLYLAARRDVRPRRERLALLAQAEAELRALPPSVERAAVLNELRFDQGIVALDVGDLQGAAARFEEMRALSREAGESEMDADYAAALPRTRAGRVDEAIDSMLDIARRARATRLESAGVTAYRSAAAAAIRVMDYPRAEIGLAEGLRYADEIEQSYCRSIMASTSAHVAWAAGRWDDAVRTAELELVEPGSRRGILSSRTTLGFVAFGRGLTDRARALLEESLAIARPSSEAELILPALWGLAETALIAGDPGRSLQHCDEALELAIQHREGPLLVPFVTTGARAALADRQPAAAQRWLDEIGPALRDSAILAGPALAHGDGLLRLAGGALVPARTALEAAAVGWLARGRIWEATWARLDLAACLLRSNRHAEAARLLADAEATARQLGSAPLEARGAELQRQARGRGAEEEAWYPLTARELEVARHIAAGLTNAQIAGELFVSPKTVSAHVEHILAKLGASRRTEIAAWVTGISQTVA